MQECNIGRRSKGGGGSKQLHRRWTKAYFLFCSSFIALLSLVLNSSSSLLLLKSSSALFYSARLAPSIKQDTASANIFSFIASYFARAKSIKPFFFLLNFSNNCSESPRWRKGDKKTSEDATRIGRASSWFLIHSHHKACDWLRDRYPRGARAGHLVAARGLSRLITTRQPTPLNRFCWQNNVFLCQCAPSCVGMCVQLRRDKIVPRAPCKESAQQSTLQKTPSLGETEALQVQERGSQTGRQTDRVADRQAAVLPTPQQEKHVLKWANLHNWQINK